MKENQCFLSEDKKNAIRIRFMRMAFLHKRYSIYYSLIFSTAPFLTSNTPLMIASL